MVGDGGGWPAVVDRRIVWVLYFLRSGLALRFSWGKHFEHASAGWSTILLLFLDSFEPLFSLADLSRLRVGLGSADLGRGHTTCMGCAVLRIQDTVLLCIGIGRTDA